MPVVEKESFWKAKGLHLKTMVNYSVKPPYYISVLAVLDWRFSCFWIAKRRKNDEMK